MRETDRASGGVGAGRWWRETSVSAASVVAVAVVFGVAWHVAVKAFGLPRILLPTPGEVAVAAWEHRGALIRGTCVTGAAASISLLAAVVTGTAISIVFSQSAMIRRAFFPYVVFLQTVPIVAIAPLLIIWSGYEFRTTVIATVIICLFPIINNVTTGLAAASKEHDELFRLYGAGRAMRLVRLQLPTAVPYLVLGMRISSGLAVVGAIVAEFFVSNGTAYEGLGVMMTGWQGLSKTDALMAALFASTFLGLALFGSVRLIAATLLRRWSRPGGVGEVVGVRN